MSFPEGTPTDTITLGGREYTLAWTHGAKLRVIRRFGTLTYDGTNEVEALERWPVMIWASMSAEDRANLSSDDVAEMVNSGNEDAIATKFRALVLTSEPGEPEGNGQPAPSQQETETRAGEDWTLRASGRSVFST